MSKQQGEWASPPSNPLSSGNPGTIPTFTMVSSHTLSISAVMINSVCLPSDDFELPRDVPSPRRFLNFSFSPESLLWGFAIADKQAALSPCKYRTGFPLKEAQGEIFKQENTSNSHHNVALTNSSGVSSCFKQGRSPTLRTKQRGAHTAPAFSTCILQLSEECGPLGYYFLEALNAQHHHIPHRATTILKPLGWFLKYKHTHRLFGGCELKYLFPVQKQWTSTEHCKADVESS